MCLNMINFDHDDGNLPRFCSSYCNYHHASMIKINNDDNHYVFLLLTQHLIFTLSIAMVMMFKMIVAMSHFPILIWVLTFCVSMMNTMETYLMDRRHIWHWFVRISTQLVDVCFGHFQVVFICRCEIFHKHYKQRL